MASSEASGPMLLSPEDSRLLSRPLRAWNHASMAIVRNACQAVYEAWCRDWGLPVGDVVVIDTSTAPPCALDDAAAERKLQAWLFGESPSGSAVGSRDMASDLRTRAWRAWQTSLGAVAPEVLPLHPLQAWSGSLTALFPWAEGTWCRLLDGAAVERILKLQTAPRAGADVVERGGKSHLVPLDHAIAGHRLTVQVHLQSVSLTVAQLQSLSAGDVVTLDHCLGDPAFLHLAPAPRTFPSPVAARPPLCTAWLGQVDGQMAVELQTGSL